jgi:hypothetical protein
MAYDRYDPRRGPREPSRNSDDPYRDREYSRRHERDERGFFERAGDEIASWFGDDEAERRRRRDERLDERDDVYGRQADRRRSYGRGRDDWRDRYDRDDDRSYRPVTGDYGRSEGRFAPTGYSRGDESRSFGRDSDWDREDLRGARFSQSFERPLPHDRQYHEWRQRQIDELDRDYDEYRRENQSRFEDDFSTWRSSRQTKRQMLGQVREHMQVVSRDDEPIGTVDRVAGDRIILAKSDPESGGVHHSLSCSEIDRVEGDKVILECNAAEARIRWRDESRERALFEREDQGEAGPRTLDRSFSGTYR